MKLNYILLGLLSFRAFDGYDIVRWLDTEGQFIRSHTHHSQVYRELGRLVTDGWATYDVERRIGSPDAKLYHITEIGQAALLDFIRSPFDPPSRFHDADFSVRFFFTVGLDLDAAKRLVAAELQYRRDQVAKNRDRDRSFAFDPMPGFDVPVVREMLAFIDQNGMRQIDAWIGFLSDLADRLDAYEEAGNR